MIQYDMICIFISSISRETESSWAEWPNSCPGTSRRSTLLSRCKNGRCNGENMMKPVVMTNIAIENVHLYWFFPLKIVIFHSYVKLPEGTPVVKQVVSDWIHTRYLPFFYGDGYWIYSGWWCTYPPEKSSSVGMKFFPMEWNKQTKTKTNIHTNKSKNKQTNKQKQKQTNKQTNKQTKANKNK